MAEDTMPDQRRSAFALLDDIAGVGVDRVRGGYSRPGFSDSEITLREWFVAEAEARGLRVETDVNGIVWAWWGGPGPGAVVTGSHLDSVPGGGAYDGPLGVVSALLAVDALAARGFEPRRPFAIAVFPEEEGSRFGVACLGSRLLTGALSARTALNLRDRDGISLGEAVRAAGLDPDRVGAEPGRVADIGTFLELHIEQGLGLAGTEHAVAVGDGVLGHGRWRISFYGQGNHAGTTRMSDRSDPMVAAARTIAAVQQLARAVPDARATVGRLEPVPGGTNVIARHVDLWLDVRHRDDTVTRRLVDDIEEVALGFAQAEGGSAVMSEESVSPTVYFDPHLRSRLSSALGDAPILDTGAGHDAAILSAHVPSAMLFVRNPTGISHAPEEACESDDAEAGVEALADVIADLTSDPVEADS